MNTSFRRIQVLLVVMLVALLLAGCSGSAAQDPASAGADTSATSAGSSAEAGSSESSGSSAGNAAFIHIGYDEAISMIDSGECTLVDVRGEPEYDYKHIPGAICIPVDSEDSDIEAALPDKTATILLYCDYGGVSKQMGDHLSLDLGYTNVYEFDGLLEWEGELEGLYEQEQ